MTFFTPEIITAPTALPIDVDDDQAALAAAVVDELERTILWRGIVHQTRMIIVDGPLDRLLEIEPTTEITISRWTPADAAEVIDANSYHAVSRDPSGTLVAPSTAWPEPERSLGSFEISYSCGWEVSDESAPGAGDAVNEVPPSIVLMIQKALEFRSGSGIAGLTVSGLTVTLAPSYSTDALPREIANIGRAYAYRPGLIVGRP